MNLLYHLDICLKQCGLLWRDVVSFDNSLGFDELHFHTKEKMNLNKLIYEDATVTNMGPRHITAYSYRMKLNNNRTFNKEVLAKLQQEGRIDFRIIFFLKNKKRHGLKIF